jgi:UDP-N-acetylglucosamine--N-acetylmuramyl-(pentapeptide) pyrophosphoryl-undecaprenol N-acetylglucosamine transferase
VATFLLAAGGTGGHLVPALALAERLSGDGHQVELLTEGRPVEDRVLGNARFVRHQMPLRGGRFLAGLRVLAAVPRSLSLLRQRRIDLVAGLGGRVTVPAALAAWALRVPLCLLEQNAVSGRANRFLARFARRIYTGLPLFLGGRLPSRRVRQAGIPLPAPLVDAAGRSGEPGGTLAREIRRSLGLLPARVTLLVTGGSQGAAILNQVVPEAVAGLGHSLQVIHLTGPGREEEVGARYRACGVGAAVKDFSREMPALYTAADLVLCRGGALTLSEAMVLGRPALVVPYPWHRDRHQERNAEVLAVGGAVRLLPQDQLTPARLRAELMPFVLDPALATRMGRIARALVRVDAAAEIARDLTTLLGNRLLQSGEGRMLRRAHA